ncbi:MAG: hypothetical protein WBA44_07795 [Mesorhizobium sp.]
MRIAAKLAVLTSLVAPLFASAPAAFSQEPGPHLALDLNAAQPTEKGCRLTFVVANNLATTLDRAAFEMALFGKSGVVDRLTVLDFRNLPTGKTKVSRFDLPNVTCTELGRVLINDATECSGEGTAADACIRNLRTSSTSGIQFGQ